MSNIPNIRFKGYTDPWEQRKLGDVIDKLTGGASIAPDDYVEEGYRTIPKGAVNGTGVADMSGCKVVTEEFFEKNKSSKTSTGELITSLRDLVPTAPNMGRIVRICGKSEDFLMPQGVYSIIVKEKIDGDFLIAYSNSPEYRKKIMMQKNGSTQVHIRNGEFLDIDIPLPSYSEQKKMGTAINNLDNFITFLQRKCDAMSELKKFMLQKMFPKNGEQFPEIRFSGFTDPWEQRKLGDITERITRKNQDLESELPLTISAQYGLIDQNEFFDKRIASKDVSGYYLVKKGEFAYNKSTSSDAPWGAVKRLDRYEKGVLSTLYIVFCIIDTEKTNTDFLVTYYDTNLWHKGVHAIAAEGARNHGLLNITPSDFFETTLSIPQDIEEQKLIGKCFMHLDTLITLHQRKCNELKVFKKYMLQNMFPKKG